MKMTQRDINTIHDSTDGEIPRRIQMEDSRLLATMIKQSDSSAWNALALSDRILDLRQTSRERRHGTVSYAFDKLGIGGSFLLVNNHDPQPLHAQMKQLRPGELAWEYEAPDPDEFRIKVSRMTPSPMPPQETVLASRGH